MSARPTTVEEIFPAPPAGLEPHMLDRSRVPAHVAIIMDGNGRWAKAHGLERGDGHKAGIRAVREAITTCNDIGVRYLTIYSFSTENWKRPATEVSGLMSLFAETMNAEIAGLMAEGVRIRLLGRANELPLATRTVLQQAEKRTAANTGMTLAMAVNYGSRMEMVDAVSSITRDVAAGTLAPQEVDEELISQRLYTADLPDPDLLIRTSGELRLSNFLLWQLAYAELYVTDVLWPDFDRYELLRALLSYQGRDRRFGSVQPQGGADGD